MNDRLNESNDIQANEETRLDQLCIDTLRTLSIDAVPKANSGHPGPLGQGVATSVGMAIALIGMRSFGMRSFGISAPDHYLAAAIDYLFQHRPIWGKQASVGKTVVSSRLIDRLTGLGRQLVEMLVGFRWFAAGLQSGARGFCGEESAGATFLRRDGSVWTTDKDGIAAALLSAEITARTGPDFGLRYAALADEFGSPVARRVEAAATEQQRKQLAAITPQQITATELAGERINSVLSHAPGNGEAIGGIKLSTAHGWFAARPSGTEDIYKIYAESFSGPEHLQRILQEAHSIVDAAISFTPSFRP